MEPNVIAVEDQYSVKQEEDAEPDLQFCQELSHSSLEVAFLFVFSGLLGVTYGVGLMDAALPEGQRSARLRSLALEADDGDAEDSRLLCCGFFSVMFLFGLFIAASVRLERPAALKKSAVLCGLLSIAHLFFTWHLVIFTEAGNVALIAVCTASSLFMFYECMVLWCYAQELKEIRDALYARQKAK